VGFSLNSMMPVLAVMREPPEPDHRHEGFDVGVFAAMAATAAGVAPWLSKEASGAPSV
jgi:hypothetical protein